MSNGTRRRSRYHLTASIAALAAAVTLAAGCGSAATTGDAGTDTSSSQSGMTQSQMTQSQVEQSGTPDGGESSSATEPSTADADPSSDSSSQPATYPVTVTAANGELTLSAQPKAIISLSPTATEMLYAVGAGDQVVAVDTYSNYPTTGLPSATIDSYKLNIEALTKFHPDLVVSSSVSPDQQKKFDALKIPVLAVPAVANLDGTYEQIDQIGEVTGHAEKAHTVVATMKSKIADIVAQAPKFDAAPTYYYELTQELYSQTSKTFLGSVLGELGLANIADKTQDAAASGGYPQLSAEFIVKSDPDYIFLADTKCCDQNPKTVAARPGWSTLSAVKGDRVIPLDDDIASRWGPRVVDLMQAVVTAMKDHPVTS